MSPTALMACSPEELRQRVAVLERERLEILGELEEAYERFASTVTVASQETDLLYGELRDRMESLERRIGELTALADVARSISSVLEIDPLAECIVEQAGRLAPADAIALYVRTDDGAFGLKAARGVTRAAAGAALDGLPPMAVRELQAAGPVTMVPDLARSRWSNLALAPDMQSALVLPLVANGDAVALLVLNGRAPDALTGTLDTVLATFGVQSAVAITNARLYRDLERVLTGVLMSLATALEAKDKYTEGHSARVAWYAVLIGKELGFGPEELENLHRAGLIHDIGKIGVGGSIIRKEGRLTDVEWEQMRKHPLTGANIIARIPLLAPVLPAVRQHHERWDGTGYPDKLAGEEIPLIARVLAVADSFDALTTDRSYRKGRSPDLALDEIRRCAGTQFDPSVVAALERCFPDMIETDKEA